MLSLNGSTGATAKQTVGVSEAFVVNHSHAGKGLSVVSGTLDYGDGSHESFAGDPGSWVPAAPHQYDSTGTVTATLTVVDSASHSVSTTLKIQIFAAPTAAVVASGTLKTNQPVTFTVTSGTPAGTSFTDFDSFSDAGDNFVDGPGAPPATFQITFADPGPHTVTVEGFNDAGAVATATVDVDIVTGP